MLAFEGILSEIRGPRDLVPHFFPVGGERFLCLLPPYSELIEFHINDTKHMSPNEMKQTKLIFSNGPILQCALSRSLFGAW